MAEPSKRPSRDSLPDAAEQSAAAREIEEVERAMAVLTGQDPEQLRRLRIARAEAEARFREIADRMARYRERAAGEKRRQRNRLAIRLAVGAAVAAAVVIGLRAGAARRARWKPIDQALDALSAPHLARGFQIQRPALATANRIELGISGASCLLALGAAEQGEAKLRIEHGGDVLSATQSAAWCTCGDEEVVVTGTGPDGALVGVRLLGAPAPSMGGSSALGFLDPPPRALGPEAGECAAEHLEAWIKDRRYPPVTVNERWLDGFEARAKLVSAGVHVVSRAASNLPLAIVEPREGSCFIALSSVESDLLSLRVEHGDKPLAKIKGPIAWCDSRAVPFAVLREGSGEVTVLAVSSRRAGGLLGVRELARRGLIGEVAVYERAEDLGLDAADTLRASGVIDPVVVFPKPVGEASKSKEARIVALSVATGGSFAADSRAGVAAACAPKLVGSTYSQSVCAQSWTQTWRQVGAEGMGGVAQAPLPFWLSIHAAVDDPTGLSREVELLALARRLTSERFEPSVLEGVTELPKGVDVIGRVGEDAIVAVGLTARPPWVFPYSDREPWPLAGEPRYIDLKPGEHVMLTAPGADVPKAERRTVVFRRPVAK